MAERCIVNLTGRESDITDCALPYSKTTLISTKWNGTKYFGERLSDLIKVAINEGNKELILSVAGVAFWDAASLLAYYNICYDDSLSAAQEELAGKGLFFHSDNEWVINTLTSNGWTHVAE